MNSKKRFTGFTLLELLITISIIIFIASLAAPSLRGFGQNRQLNGAGGIIQGIFLKARSVAISRKTDVRIVFFINSETETIEKGNISTDVKGRVGTMHVFFLDKSVQPNIFRLADESSDLPENTRFLVPGETKIYSLHPDGTITFSGDTDGDPEVDDTSIADVDEYDIIISQLSSDKNCYIDIIRNTGRISFFVR